MAFEVPFQVHPSHFYGHYTTNLALCDFSSAGNDWSEKNLYRTWLPQPLFLGNAFASHTWNLLNPHSARGTSPGDPNACAGEGCRSQTVARNSYYGLDPTHNHEQHHPP